MLGRRGPAQAAFTTPELQELTELAGADLVVDPADLELGPASEAALADDTAIASGKIEVLREAAAAAPAGKPKRCGCGFCVSPVAILGDGRSRQSRSCATSWRRTGAAGSGRSRPTSGR